RGRSSDRHRGGPRDRTPLDRKTSPRLPGCERKAHPPPPGAVCFPPPASPAPPPHRPGEGYREQGAALDDPHQPRGQQAA
ncbi:hypothetical protein ABTN05_20835, partial [Acinetobacter baumannii]